MAPTVSLTFSSSGSLRARANSLLSMTDAAATSKGVEPRMDGDAEKERVEEERYEWQRKVEDRLRTGSDHRGFKIP